jgi:glucosamine--fructose-6-phosphate aminotransferase (isomerizing)
MCGIVGYVGKRETATLLIEGLRRLEYRGYDSPASPFSRKTRSKSEGKRELGKLEELIKEKLRRNGRSRSYPGYPRETLR